MFPLIHRTPSVNSVSLIRQMFGWETKGGETNISGRSKIISQENRSIFIQIIVVKSAAMTGLSDRN